MSDTTDTTDGRDEQGATSRDDQRQDEARDDNHDGGDRDRGDDGLGDAGKKALEAERRNAKAAQRAARDAERRVQELADKVAEYERAQMSDQQRVESERDDWRKKYEDLNNALAAKDLEILRRDVAAEKGLSPALARRLQGATREELESDADDLRSQIPARPAEVPPVPKPDPTQGASSRGVRANTVGQAISDYMSHRQPTGTA